MKMENTELLSLLEFKAAYLKNGIDQLLNHIDEDFFTVANLIGKENRCIFFSGVGKSGVIAQKALASFASIGFKSFFLDPLNALHGDIGAVHENDIVFLISNSGKTQELNQLIPLLKERNVKMISVTKSKSTPLSKKVDYALTTESGKEICPLNLAPTLSTTLTLVLFDLLLIAVMKKKKVEKEVFAKNHPAGSLGKKLYLKVSDLLEKDEYIITEDTPFTDVIHLVSKARKGLGVVMSDGKIQGVITDGDIRRLLEKEKENVFSLKAKDMMTKNPKVITNTILAKEALDLMEQHNITALPVIDEEGNYFGTLSIYSILEEF